MAFDLTIRTSYRYIPSTSATYRHRPFSLSLFDSRTLQLESWKLLEHRLSVSSSNRVAASPGTLFPETSCDEVLLENGYVNNTMARKRRVFLLDVNPLRYQGSTPSLQSFAHWISLFFSQVSLNDPVIAVLDGESGNEHRRQLLPSYKANRRKLFQQVPMLKRFPRSVFRRPEKLIKDVLQKCNVPILKIEEHEADDVVATLVDQVLGRGYRVAIASPDKDFKQLISEDVQIVLPVPEFDRWSFYTLKHYVDQYSCDPQSDLSLSGEEIIYIPFWVFLRLRRAIFVRMHFRR